MSLDDIFNAIPLQAGQLKDARSVDRTASQSHAMEVKAEARIGTEVGKPDLCGRRRIVLQQLMPGRRFVFRILRDRNAEPVRDQEAMVRRRHLLRINATEPGLMFNHRPRNIIKLRLSQHNGAGASVGKND